MANERTLLPCPPLTIRLELPPGEPPDETRFRALPAKPGVLVIEDEPGGTQVLLTTANLRRAAVTRLGPVPERQPRSARANLRGIARRILATTVGSAFEADWAYLQLARARLPHSYRHMLDRWQAWFIHCDQSQRFPQWIKTSRPGAPSADDGSGTYVGPFADKHAAHRFIEVLEDAFDLCRYHHILVQAPHGTACAYKEMGRCPAPCDGSIGMPAYLQQVGDSVAFAREPQQWPARLGDRMRASSEALDFEAAQRCKTVLDRIEAANKPRFAHVRDLRDFRFLAVLPSEREGWARLILVDGGWIAPVMDVLCDSAAESVAEFAAHACSEAPPHAGVSDAAIENMGMVCRHMLMPRAQARRRRAEFIPLREVGDLALIVRAIAAVARSSQGQDESDSVPAEQELEAS